MVRELAYAVERAGSWGNPTSCSQAEKRQHDTGSGDYFLAGAFEQEIVLSPMDMPDTVLLFMESPVPSALFRLRRALLRTSPHRSLQNSYT
jgi:hypothetical protein